LRGKLYSLRKERYWVSRIREKKFRRKELLARNLRINKFFKVSDHDVPKRGSIPEEAITNRREKTRLLRESYLYLQWTLRNESLRKEGGSGMCRGG